MTAAYADFVKVEVVNRAIFYNNSFYDGGDATANRNDESAIAVDKAPLLPGETASFRNYTSYSLGINGVMVDIAGLPDTPTLADFKFQSGTSPDTDDWQEASLPSMSIRPGGGPLGSDRFTFIWDSEAVRNSWLKVTVLATARTGLKSPDVFYFGNAVGESGDSRIRARVDATDEVAVRNNRASFLNKVSVGNTYDFNRDGFVNATDQLIARSHMTLLSSSLPLLTPSQAIANSPATDPDGFSPFKDGYYSEYAPTLVKSAGGVLLLFVEARFGIPDDTSRGILMRRSFDNGTTWTDPQLIYHEQEDLPAHNPTAVVDEVTGTVSLIFTRDRLHMYSIRSSNDGATWSVPEDITASVRYVDPNTPGGVAYHSEFNIYDSGPGHGIQLKNGPFAGRLIITANHRLAAYDSGYSWSNIIYSDDHGLTWHLGGGMTAFEMPDMYTNEASIVELNNGDLYMNMRIQNDLRQNGQNYRGSAVSHDGGMTWSRVKKELALTAPSVQASLIRLNDHVIAFAAPDSPTDNLRRQMTIWLSYDEAQTWVKTNVVYYSYAGYSDMVVVGPDTILLGFNSGLENVVNAWHQRVSLARFNLDWLESRQAQAFEWNFNEQSPGTFIAAGPPSLRDDGQWDLRATVQAKNERAAYVAGQYADAALALTGDTDRVLLTPSTIQALQLDGNDSLRTEIDFHTLDNDGVLVGSMPGLNGWSIDVVDGHARFRVKDSTTAASITSVQRVDDGGWHHLVVTRDRLTGLLQLSLDSVSAASVIDATLDLRASESITLGSYRDGSSQLALTVDRLRIVVS